MSQIVAPAVDWGALGPLLVVALTGGIVLVASLLIRTERFGLLTGITLIGLSFAMISAILQWGANRSAFGGMIAADSFFVFFAVVALLIAFLATLLSASYAPGEHLAYGEYLSILLFATAGALILVASTNLLALILGLEILSIALYVLAGFARGKVSSEEAALKYFLLGAFSLGFLMYGSALLYGATGSIGFSDIAKSLSQPGGVQNPLALAGMVLILVGFGFKLALVPFHMWTPDVYDGAPTSVTAFMAAGTKVAIFAALLRILYLALPSFQTEWSLLLGWLAILSMVLGNVAAVVQRNLKRMLAYSSIAQAGYVLIGVLGGTGAAAESVMFYLVAYAAMTLGAFGVLIALSIGPEERVDIEDYAGLASKSPYLAAVMALCMLSLAGLPPTAGFIAKLSVFTSAVQAGRIDLALIGVLTSAVGVFYYIRVVVVMYMRGPSKLAEVRLPATLVAGLAISGAATLIIGLVPAILFGMSQSAIVFGR